MYDTLYAILANSTNATLQYFIFCKKALDKNHLLKLNNVFKTSSKRFVKAPPIYLAWCLSSFPYLRLKLYSLNFAIAHAQKRLICLSECALLVLH